MIEWLLQNDKLINVFSGIGTFVSALIAIFTLKEVKKQRLSMYKPEILIKSFIVSISKSPLLKNQDELLEYKTATYNDYSSNYNEIKFNISHNYKVDNVGFGLAKKVVCKWDFDVKKAFSKIDEILPSNFDLSCHKNLSLHILNKTDDVNFHYSTYGKIEEQKIDYLTPINVQQHSHFHVIPDVIIFTHYLFLIFKNNLIEEESENFYVYEFEDFPKPKLNISYFDINDKKYEKEIVFKIEAVSSQVGDKLDMKSDFSSIQFEVL